MAISNMTDINELQLRVNGSVYQGWTGIKIHKSLENLANGFDLQLSTEEALPDWKIPPGEKCEIRLGADVVLVGYVDDRAVSYSAAQHDLKITGRDRLGDLVDCSAPSKRYTGLSLPELAAQLAEPFDIHVVNQVKGLHFQRVAHANQPGESIHRVLERLARQEGVLLISDGRGALLVTQPGAGGDAEVTIEYGRDIESASFQHSSADLYSEIIVKGQAAGASQYSLKDTVQPAGQVSRKVEDKGIRRYRPLCIIAESAANSARCARRAGWEAGSREAKSKRWEVTVSGWRDANGVLWDINKFVHLKCPLMGVDEQLLISSVEFSLDEDGSTTNLKLSKKDAFKELPEIPQPKKAAGSEFSLK